MYIEEIQQEVEDAIDFECTAEDIIDDLGRELEKQDLTRPVEEDDGLAGEGWSFIWLPEGQKKMRAEISRMAEIGKKYFPDYFFSFNPTMYREP